MKVSTAVAFGAVFGKATALQIKQVSFEDPLAQDGSDNVDSRDVKINEAGEGGSECFVYSSEAVNGVSGLSFKDWHIWQTCGVFDGGPLTNKLLAGDKSGSEIDYEFADTDGDGGRVCWEEDLPGSGGVSIQLLDGGQDDEVVDITDSEATDRERNSKRCNLSRDGSALAFESDDNTLLPDDTQDGQEHAYYTDDRGASFLRLVPEDYYQDCVLGGCESVWPALSGDGSAAAFHSGIRYPGASASATETYLWRKSDGAIHKVTEFAGKECNRTRSYEMLVEMYGQAALDANDLGDETKLGSGQAQCEGFAVAGLLPETGAGTIDVKANPASISDDGRFVTFMAAFESATMKGTLEPVTPVSRANTFLYDSKLGITWAVTKEYQSQTPFKDEGPIDLEPLCCPYATSSRQRDTCTERNEIRQDCCWQKPCYTPGVTTQISGNGHFIVVQGDLVPGDTTQVPLDWEIMYFHVPTGKTVLVADTDDKAHQQIFPSISRKGDVVAFTSKFDFTTMEPITSNWQIFAAKIETGCSRDSSASNYHPSPDVETCCEWDGVPAPHPHGGLKAVLPFHGDPDEMKANVAFGESEAWCAEYVEQVRKDVACSLAVPKEYVVVKEDTDCGGWESEGIEVTLILKENPINKVTHTCTRLNEQYKAMGSSLWNGYLTKTMKMDMDYHPCELPDSSSTSKSSKNSKSGKSTSSKHSKSTSKSKSSHHSHHSTSHHSHHSTSSTSHESTSSHSHDWGSAAYINSAGAFSYPNAFSHPNPET